MMSVAQTLIGVGTMIYPILVQFLMDKYGFRGAMAILAAINGHAILGMMVMHPVEWHYKVTKVPIDEEKPCKLSFYYHLGLMLLFSNKFSLRFPFQFLTFPVMNSIEKEPEVKIVVMSENNCELKPYDIDRNRLSIPNGNSIKNDIINDPGALKSERSRSLDPTHALDGFDPTRRRVSSISSLGNWTGAVIVSEVPEAIKLNGKWYSKLSAHWLNSFANLFISSSGKRLWIFSI